MAILWGALFLAIGVVGDHVALRNGYRLLFVNDILSAAIVAILVFMYERRRRRQILQRLEIIRQMNHHVRNALQVIAFSPYAQTDKQTLAPIYEAVNHIEWALREILPGDLRKRETDTNSKAHAA